MSGTTKPPSFSVGASRLKPVLILVTVTFAPTIAAAAGSRTRPVIVPVGSAAVKEKQPGIPV